MHTVGFHGPPDIRDMLCDHRQKRDDVFSQCPLVDVAFNPPDCGKVHEQVCERRCCSRSDFRPIRLPFSVPPYFRVTPSILFSLPCFLHCHPSLANFLSLSESELPAIHVEETLLSDLDNISPLLCCFTHNTWSLMESIIVKIKSPIYDLIG